MDSSDLTTEQPLPVPSDRPSVQGLVRADLEVREQLGRERYGDSLRPHNGRDALRDLYEELIDAALYARQAIEERPREDVDAAVAAVRAELEPEIRRKDYLIAELRRQYAVAERVRDEYVAEVRQQRPIVCAARTYYRENGETDAHNDLMDAVRAVEES